MILMQIAVMVMSFVEFTITYHHPEWVTAPQDDLYSDLIEYTLYEDELSWNDAATICRNNQAQMLSIKSQEKLDLIEEFKLNEWSLLTSKDYWSGLTEPTEGVYMWEDCTNMSSTFNMRKIESYNDANLCYKVKHDTLQWDSDKCENKRYVVCEKIIQGACNHSTILSSNKVATFSNMSTAQCQTACGGSSSCWSGISTQAGLCILLESRSGSEALTEVTMFKKCCVTVSFVENNMVPTVSPENNDRQPLLNCSQVQPSVTPQYISESIPESTIMDISPTPCYLYETVNITNIYNTTETINVTSIINETQIVVTTETLHATTSVELIFTINVTETLNVTEPIYVTMTMTETAMFAVTEHFSAILTVTSTINVTQTYNVTKVYNYTSTYNASCSASCFNATYQFLSTDDPLLLEAIASRQQELTVNKKETNAHIRALTSATDHRTSSRIIGTSGLVLIIIPLALIIIGDIPSVFRGCATRINRYRNKESFEM